jgi:guanine deaminase
MAEAPGHRVPAASKITALRGRAISFTADPFLVPPKYALRHESDGLIVIENGIITAFGPYDVTRAALPPGSTVTRLGSDSLIMPGFIDTHVCYPHTQTIGVAETAGSSPKDAVWQVEQQFANERHARDVAAVFLRELLRAGTTTAAVSCAVFPTSVDVFFEESHRLNTRMVAGKVLMDRNVPSAVRDSAQRGYDESRELSQRWHEHGRQLYCITAHSIATSTPAQLDAAKTLRHEQRGTYFQSNVAETQAEGASVRQMHPDCRSALDVYDRNGLLGPRTVLGHGVWFEENDFYRCHDTGTAIAHCPSADLFLGSGVFSIHSAKRSYRPVRCGFGTDLGAGTSCSTLATMNQAYKMAQLSGNTLNALQAFYLATAGGAHALYLDDRIGFIAPGYEADLVVLDLHSTPLIDYRMRVCRDIEEALLIQMVLGDDRAVRATYVAGELRHERDAATTAPSREGGAIA